ncbi:MAG: tyrosine-type recombinase/integrase [Flavobacteriaceae bacterium]
MAIVTYTLIKSSNKKNKGAKYPRFRINLQNGTKPFFRPFKDVLIYKRADTPEKKIITSKGKRMLQEIKNELEDQYKGSQYSQISSESISLNKHLNEIISLKKEKTDSTQKGYIQMASAVETFCEKKGYNFNMDLNTINIEFVDKYRVWLVEKYNGSTPGKYFDLLGTALNIAKRYGRIYNNPYDMKPERPKAKKGKMIYLTPEEVQKMKYTPFTKYQQLKDAFLFMCHTGIRQGDCCKMRWSDLPIIDGVTKMLLKTEKADTEIFFQLPKRCIEFLPKRRGDDDKVFLNLRFDSDTNEKLRMWAYKSGIKKHIVPHTARHTFAFYMLSENKIPLYTVSKLMGHKNARTTEESYGHLSNENIEQAMAKAFGN